ncbi:jg4770 [Pararge aegeria aegeria]|uniref:Jg4770 protein n=1 Tax=Pararge aegeria aegeria TaxID=348720 RepID=A0A8S4R6F5_9NEOP|nr:jg4770 [Pararge aegeria aegeria]
MFVIQIKPSLNSAVIVISNGIYYIFKALTSYLMKKHCERWVNATIIYWNYGSGSIFYFWPLYFATIQYGAIFAVIFFALNAIVEYCMFLITFQCLIEAVKYEWRWIKPWCISAIILVFAITEVVVVRDDFSENSFVFYMGLSSLAEILIIFWAYPLSRFLDDITFHFGVTPTRLRRWSFRLLPIFYLYKVYMMLHKFYIFSDTYNIFNYLHTSRYAPTCISVLFAVGALYAFYYNVIKEKKGFCQLFKPVPEWGPKDYRLRQLRKQFLYREYIVSQAPRDLSRYLIEKSDLGSYKLDVPYADRRRSTVCDAKKVKENEL